MNESEDDINTKMEQAFHEGAIDKLTSKEREEFLKHLCAKSKSVISGVLDPREINRATLLSLYKHQEFIDKIEKSNRLMTITAVSAGVLALFVSIYSIYSTWDVADNIERIAISTEKLNSNTINAINSVTAKSKLPQPESAPNTSPQPTPKSGAAGL